MSKPRVFVSRVIPAEGVKRLREAFDVEVNESDRPLSKPALIRKLRGRQGLVSLLTDKIDDDVCAVAGLKAVCNVAVGFDNIDLAAATRRGVLATNTPGVLTETTADFAWCLLMAAARRLGEGERMMRAGGYRGWGILMLLGQDVFGKTLGLVGLGRIGQAVARRAKGFGMRVLYSDSQRASEEVEKRLGARFTPLDFLLRESDFVSLHAPLLPETRHLIGAKELALMRPTAVLVNTARGPLIDEKALVKCLRERRIAAAGLDVYEREPKLAYGLARLDNAVLAPHIASASVETRTRMALIAAENMHAALSGKRPPNLVNVEVWQTLDSHAGRWIVERGK